MQIGMMGLGRMGANMVRRMLRGGHECVVYDINPANVEALVKEGATGASSLEEFVSKLTPPKTAWLMLPAAITGKMADEVAALGAGRHRRLTAATPSTATRSTRRSSSPQGTSISSMSGPAAAFGGWNEAIA
jgi:prephenate dehydrogenase